MIKSRVYTLQTRICKEDALYFEQFITLYSKLLRRIYQDIRHGVRTDSKYISSLMQRYNLMKRTVNSAVKYMQGRIKALESLQKQQIHDVKQKVSSLEGRILELKKQIGVSQDYIIKHPNDKEKLRLYKNKKSKLFSLQRKLQRYKSKIANYDNPDIINLNMCFGTRKMWAKQYHLAENGYKTHEKWLNDFRKKRDSMVYYLGSSDETCGNQMFQIYYDDCLDTFIAKVRKEKSWDSNSKYVTDMQLKYRYNKDLSKDWRRQGLLDVLGRQALSYNILRKGNKWYIDVSFSGSKEIAETHKNGCIGVDFNNGFLAMSETDGKGNLVNMGRWNLNYHGCGNRAKNEMSLYVNRLVRYCSNRQKALSIEDLTFSKKKSERISKVGKRYNSMIHRLDYTRFRTLCETISYNYGVELRVVNPAYTSVHGREYGNRRKLNVHTGASYEIARRGQNYRDVV